MSYRPASLCSLATQFQTRFLESIHRFIAGHKFSTQCCANPLCPHCKKRLAVFPSPAGSHLPNSPWPGIYKLFLARKSLVSDILAGNRKTTNLFLQCSPFRLIWYDNHYFSPYYPIHFIFHKNYFSQYFSIPFTL